MINAQNEGRQPLTALVVGAGVGGLIASHVACQHFESVTLLEADSKACSTAGGGASSVLQGAKQHRGIPQYQHPHTLAAGGLEAMDKLLPGFQDELVRRGGLRIDILRDIRIYDMGALYARGESSLKSVGASRHLVQTTLQDEVMRRNSGRLAIRYGCRVSGLLWSEDKSSVMGVELGNGEALPADVVIVSTGRSSRLPQWLAAGGHAAPPVKRVDAKFTYVTSTWKMPEDWEGDWMGHLTQERPNGLRGAGLVPAEGGMWQLFLWGTNGVVPPMEEEQYLQYLGSLPDPEMYRAIKRAQLLIPLTKYAGTANIQRAWDKVALPAGLLVLGDAVQALNPVYGQGMSVASQSAVALDAAMHAALAKAGGSAEARRAALRGMGPAFHRKLAAVIEPAWQLATSEDLRHPATTAEGVSRPHALVSAYMNSLMRACHRDIKVTEILWGVAHMTRPPWHAFHPRLLAAAVRDVLHYSLDLLAGLLPAGSSGYKKAE